MEGLLLELGNGRFRPRLFNLWERPSFHGQIGRPSRKKTGITHSNRLQAKFLSYRASFVIQSAG
jgi:hypothetical protein